MHLGDLIQIVFQEFINRLFVKCVRINNIYALYVLRDKISFSLKEIVKHYKNLNFFFNKFRQQWM